jgi:hypothetical protein
MAENLTGRWEGHYYQHGQGHPISMELIQEGDRLRGTMRDGDTVSQKSVFETAVDAGLPPGADEQIVDSLREMFPHLGRAPIRARSELPPDSIIEGQVEGRTVTFMKTYQGEHFVGYEVGEERVGVTIEGHSVHYRGRLTDEGRGLEGDWWIDQELPEGGVSRMSGSFLLLRRL